MEDVVWRLLLLGAVVAAAVAVSWRRRHVRPAPTQPRTEVPAQLDRTDFSAPQSPWLVVVFTSATCATCGDVARKAAVLASREVVVQEVEYVRDRALHDKYRIDAVPATVIADADGVTRYGRLGPVSATDLWAAMARCRDPQLATPQCGDVSEGG